MLVRTVAPTELPLSLDELRSHLRIDGTNSDADIMSYARAAIDYLDGPTGVLNRALCTQTLQLKLHDFPRRDWFDLPMVPLQSVSSITYLDSNGVTQTFAAGDYRVLNANDRTYYGRVELGYGETWPTTRSVQQAVTVTYIAGFGARNDVPEELRHVVRLLAGHFYEQRDAVAIGNVNVQDIPWTLRALVDKWTVWSFG